jgi:RND family efflux transporter MFP subunit
VVACLAGTSRAGEDARAPSIKLSTHKVQREKLQPELVERGVVEAADTADIVCRVKAPDKGSTVATTIKRVLVEDGEAVKKGQLLAELDASALEDQLKTQEMARDQARRALALAEENLALQRSQAESDLDTARVSLQLAELNLEKYLKSDVEQTLQDHKGRLTLAEAEVERLSEALAEAERKFKAKEGSESQVRAARLRLDAAQLAVAKVKREQQDFEKYSRPLMELNLRTTLKEAQRAQGRAEQLAKSREALLRQEIDSRKAALEQEAARCRDLQDEIAQCKLHAPRDGLAVYFVPEQTRGAGQQPIVAQGEPVREGQKLMTIADLGKMQVAVRVPEALVSQVRPGLAATVRVDAFPNRALHGKVARVEPKPVQRDWMTTDVKVYPTIIALEGDTGGLRPGMSATVTSPLGMAADNVLAVPVRAVIGRAGLGTTASCLVQTAEGPEEREISLGRGSEKMVEVRSGLREGDEVIVNPRLLLDTLRDRIRFLHGGRPQPPGGR